MLSNYFLDIIDDDFGLIEFEVNLSSSNHADCWIVELVAVREKGFDKKIQGPIACALYDIHHDEVDRIAISRFMKDISEEKTMGALNGY